MATSSWFGIHLDLPQPAAERRLDRDLLAQGAPQQVRHAGNQTADIDWPRFQRLLTRESEQPLGERLPAPRATHCVVSRAFQALDVGSGLAQMTLQGVEIADDDGQQVVEVVRHAAGELAHALHLLDLPQLLLGGTALGEIARHLGEADQLAICCREWR